MAMAHQSAPRAATSSISRRHVLRGALGGLLVLGGGALAAACGATPAATETPASTPEVTPGATAAAMAPVTTGRPAVTIKFLQYTFANDEAQWWATGIERFRLRHPDVVVEHTPVRWDNYWERVALHAATNQMPDTLLMTTMHTPQYARLGALQSLGPFTRLDRTLHLDDQWPAIRHATTVEGKGPYLLLYELAPQGVYINKTLFKQAGLVDPTALLPNYWTFDEFRQAAVTLSGKLDGGFQYGVSNPPTLWLAADALMRSHGGGFASADNSRTLLDTPESIKTMEHIVELFSNAQVAPPISAGQIGRLWESGRIAMDIGGPERAFRFRDRVRFEWDVAPLPVSSRTRMKVNAAQGSGLALGHGSLQVEATWLFISEMLSSDNLAEMVGKPARAVPGRPSARESLLRSDRPPRHLSVFVEGAEAASCLAVSNFDQFQQLIDAAGNAIFRGERTVAETLRSLAPRVEALLRF
jgi:multiple sugar transport system substrate-binding protein